MKSSFLPGPREHVREQQTQVRELLPFVAGHLVRERALEVHDLVVRQRHDEPLAVLVEHRERELVVMKAAVHGSSEK